MSLPQPAPVAVETVPRTRRSVFANFQSSNEDVGPVPSADLAPRPAAEAAPAGCGDAAFARSFLFQFLARAFDYPSTEVWTWLSSASTLQSIEGAARTLDGPSARPLGSAGTTLIRALTGAEFEPFHDDYIKAIGHAARGSCPINEIEYGDLKADPLFQPHRLADLAAFYRAFGVEMGPSADERHDHLSVELEFMGVLTAQEAGLLNVSREEEQLSVCHDAQRKFLRDHLARWTPAFARRLHRAVGDGVLGTLALFLLALVEHECGRGGVTPGSEDLLLRPADEAASLCDGCGLQNLPPGAVPPA